MSDVRTSPSQQAAYAVSTWLFQLYSAGQPLNDDALRQACADVDSAEDAAAGEVAGEALVARVSTLLAEQPPEALAGSVVGSAAQLGEGDRPARSQAIRRYQFETGLPWLACIYQREDGEVLPVWLVIERVTDVVLAMDPNPWNDVDETQVIPVDDFQVLWELSGCAHVAITRA